MLTQVTLVFIGGGLGSVLRFFIGYFFTSRNFNSIYATLISNVLACLLIAFILSQSSNKTTHTQLLWSVGFCGGLSTFSTFSWQNWQLIQSQQWSFLTFNILSSLILTIGAIWLGLKLS